MLPRQAPPPLADALPRLEEAGVIGLLESLVGLGDEGGGPFHALLAAGDLLGELPQAHSLGEKQEPRSQMKGFGRRTGCSLPGSLIRFTHTGHKILLCAKSDLHLFQIEFFNVSQLPGVAK